MGSDDVIERWGSAKDTGLATGDFWDAGDALCAEIVRLRAVLSDVRRALPDRPPGHLNHAWNENRDIGRMNYHMNVTRGQLHAAYIALEKFEDAVLTAPASDEGGECRECKGTGRVTYPNPPGVEYPCPSCTEPTTASASSPDSSELPELESSKE